MICIKYLAFRIVFFNYFYACVAMFIIPQLALGAKEAVSWMRLNQLRERLCVSATIWLTLLCCLVRVWNSEKNINLPYKRLDTLESLSHYLPWQSLYSSMLVSGKFNKIPLFWHKFIGTKTCMHITCSLLVKHLCTILCVYVCHACWCDCWPARVHGPRHSY